MRAASAVDVLILTILWLIGTLASIWDVVKLRRRVETLEQTLSAHPETAKPATPAQANDK